MNWPKLTISGKNPGTGEDLEDTTECANNLEEACDCSTFGDGYACVQSDQCLDVNDPPIVTDLDSCLFKVALIYFRTLRKWSVILGLFFLHGAGCPGTMPWSPQ